MAEEIQTLGQKAVGLSFNPSGSKDVEYSKLLFSKVIDQLIELQSMTESHEVKRLASVAIAEAQGAQMWATKALTWKD